ncbi:MAG: glycosyltransferase family 39 protein [Chloroflexota bacterium]
MGESDKVEQLLAKARARWRAESGQAPAELHVTPYLAPAAGAEQMHDVQYSGRVSQPGAPRRYTGRAAGTQPAPSPGVEAQPATRRRAGSGEPAQPVSIRSRLTRSVVVPWSFRLVLAVTVVSAVLLAWRLPGLLTPPVDAPYGVEATHAAFAQVLASRVPSTLDSVRLLPPPSPWYGSAPTNPSAGLPLYGWITAGVMSALGSGAWVGRAVSVVFSVLAGLFLFATVRRTAGARAAIYALLLYAVAPMSVLVGQEFSPTAMLLASQAWMLLALVRWRMLANASSSGSTPLAFGVAILSAIVGGLIDPGAVFMAIPAAYIIIAPSGSANPFIRGGAGSWSEAWKQSPDRGKAIGFIGAIAGSSILWWVFNQGTPGGLWLAVGDGGGGVAAGLAALVNGSTYVQIVGLTVERVLTVAGLLLLGAGLLHAARPPMQMIFHALLAGGLLHVLSDAGRLPVHDDVLVPLILPLCALAGIGAAWAGALPARLWLAVKEQTRENEADYAISPHTAWLLDLPEERVYTERPSRPQAQLALSKSVAQRSQTEGLRLRRVWLLAAGHIAVFTVLAMIVAGGAPSVFAKLAPSGKSVEVSMIGAEVASLLPRDARLVIAGPFAPELFFSSGHTGWSLNTDTFSIAEVQSLQRQGAAFLLSADQDWLGHHPDYRGLITSYSVMKLSHDYILFDLNKKPADNDRLYFLESGHTLGGAFRTYWDRNGGVAKLGYPISEELVEPNPLDGQTRTVQYFERAVLELHPDQGAAPGTVMLASVGRWVTQNREFPRVEPFQNTPDRWYFADTGHMVKQAFLHYWQSQGGVAMFGYPISEELPEINPGDGKVYTVQYFERARFEWHPTFAGTPDEVQLGLIGKQALERAGR